MPCLRRDIRSAAKTDPELKGGRSSSLQPGVFFAGTTKKEAGFMLLVSPTPRMAKSEPAVVLARNAQCQKSRVM